MLDKLRLSITSPATFFKKNKEKSVINAFTFLALWSIPGIILGAILNLVFDASLTSLLGLPQTYGGLDGALFTIIFIPLIYLFGLGWSFVSAGILHIWILIFGGDDVYSKNYQLSVYSDSIIFLFGWIPFIGTIAWFYSVYVLIVGTATIHKNISMTKAVWMFVIPFAVFMLLGMLLLGFALMMMVGSENMAGYAFTQYF